MPLGAQVIEAAAPRDSSYQPLVPLLAAFALGIVVDSSCPLAATHWWWLALLLLGAWMWLRYRGQHLLALVALSFALATTGGGWHHASWRLYSPADIGRFAREASAPTCVRAVIVSPPERVPAPHYSALRGRPQGDETRCVLRLKGIRNGVTWRDADGRAEFAVQGHLLALTVGDEVEIFAHLSAPSAPLNPGEFDFRQHERANRTLALLRAETPDAVRLLEPGSKWNPTNWIGRLRMFGRRLLAHYLSPERSDLASALLLGLRDPIPFEETQAYLKTGTIHLLSISGLHVAAIATFLLYAARSGLLPRRGTFVAVAGVTAGYALLADANPPVVRATVLVGLFCLAAILGRRTLSFNGLAAAALAVLVLSPADLFRTGTQLSFLAVATLALFRDWLMPEPPRDPLDQLLLATRPWPVRFLRGAFSWLARIWLASFLIWATALPLVMQQYHLVSPIATIINPIIGVPAAIALVMGLGVLVCGWALPPFASACGWICDACLDSMERLVNSAQHWPGSYYWVAGPAAWWVLGSYVLLGAYAAFPAWRPSRRLGFALAALWIALGQISTVPFERLTWRSRDELACTFISVGHGTSVLLELPDGRTLLYDCGGGGSPQSTTRRVEAVLWSRGITHLDAVIVSHADLDHYNGLPGVLERTSVGAVYVSPIMFRGDPPALVELRSAIEAGGVPIRELVAGDRLDAGPETRLTVLHPVAGIYHKSDNANSIVLEIEYAGTTLILPGDLEPPGLQQLLAEEPRPTPVVMAPHHGSANSNPHGFAAWTTPTKYVVISGGRGHDYVPVQDAYGEAGAEVLHTAERGAIRFSITAAGIAVDPFRD